MDYRTIKINKDKNIGKVLFIVEGSRTEFTLLYKIFTGIFDYTYEMLNRNEKYRKFTSKVNELSSVFVINTEESNINYIDDSNDYLDNLFKVLIDEYKFPVDKAAIFYIFDRDVKSNTNTEFIKGLIGDLTNSRESKGFNMPGLLLLNYPSIESFVASNFINDTYNLEFLTGKKLKAYNNEQRINQNNISDESICFAVEEMSKYLESIEINSYDLDNFEVTNLEVFNSQERNYVKNYKYILISLFSLALIDLGLIEIVE